MSRSPPENFSWLGKLLRAARVPGHDSLPADLGTSVEQAWSAAAERLHLTQQQLAEHVAGHYRLKVWSGETPRRDVAQRLPERFARQYKVLAVEAQGEELLVATSQPDRPEMWAQLRFAANATVRLVVAPPDQIALQTLEAYGEPRGERSALGLFDLDDAGEERSSASIRLVNVMLREAIRQGASDLHVQPVSGGGKVRFRVDGILHRVALLRRPVLNQVIGRFKAIAGMDTADRTRPQDGHAWVQLEGVRYDLRLSTVPTDGAEKLVVRFLARLSGTSLEALGMDEPELGQLDRLLDHGMGLLLVTGPTGSGKTTTLYAALAERNLPEVNIVTVEEPVEYRIPRLTQIDVNPRAELTFATALRAVLRQDPDIVLIGEIRDQETAEIAVQAALTGHLVLATLHANDALSVIARLVDLGIRPLLLSEVLIGASAQRLMPRLCEHCKQPAAEPFTAQEQWAMAHAGVSAPMRPQGCEHCRFRGFKGRMLISQVFSVDPESSALIAQGGQRQALERQARQRGMRTLALSALARVQKGLSTLQEAERTVGHQIWEEWAREFGAPPPERSSAARPVAQAPDEAAPPQALLLARQPARLAAMSQAVAAAGFAVDAAGSFADAMRLLQRQGGYTLGVLDLEGLRLELVKAAEQVQGKPAAKVDKSDKGPPGEGILQSLLALRAQVAGAALPLLVLTDEPSPALRERLAREQDILLAARPQDDGAWSGLLAQTCELGDDEG